MARRPGEWVLLSYRIPREPTTPRITVWRKLERLGVARLGDGLVALPADARTRELLEWLAEDVVESDGTATVWLARPCSAAQENAIIESMRAARAAEYRAIIEQTKGPAPRVATLRAGLRRIDRRDFFPPPERDLAHAAVSELARAENSSANPEANTRAGTR